MKLLIIASGVVIIALAAWVGYVIGVMHGETTQWEELENARERLKHK